MELLDKVWLKDIHFLCGNDISVADIQGVCELTQLNAVHEEKLFEDSGVASIEATEAAAAVKKITA